MHANCVAVDEVLAAAGVPGRVRMLDEPAPTAIAAAALVGVEVGVPHAVFPTTFEELVTLTGGLPSEVA